MLLWIPLLGGCADDPDPKGTDPDPTDTESPPTLTTDGAVDALTIDGRIDWRYDFDAVAEAQGQSDCDHARVFTGQEVPGLEENVCVDAPCDHVFFGRSVIPEENRACYRQVATFGFAYAQPEVWAVGPDGWMRYTFAGFGVLSPAPTDQEPAVGEVVTATVAGSGLFASPAGTYGYEQSMTLTYDVDPTVAAADPDVELDAYVCGWPTGGPRVRRGPIAFGEPLPDHVLTDQCGQPVHTNDLTGGFTLLLLASAECDTCAAAASQVRPLLEAHPDLTVATLFLGDDAAYDAWREAYHPRGPLLRDDGWGRLVTWSLLFTTSESAWVLVDPDGVPATAGTGFTSWSVLDPFLP
jgi:hypothetical protein